VAAQGYDAVASGAPRSVSADQSHRHVWRGKNMALAIDIGLLAAASLRRKGRCPTTNWPNIFSARTPLGSIHGASGTAWLIQWQVAGDPRMTTTWYWAFNHLTAQTFDHETLSSSILQYCRRGSGRELRIRRYADVECFIRVMCPDPTSRREDALEPVLAELGLIRPVSGRLYEFRRGRSRVFLMASLHTP